MLFTAWYGSKNCWYKSYVNLIEVRSTSIILIVKYSYLFNTCLAKSYRECLKPHRVPFIPFLYIIIYNNGAFTQIYIWPLIFDPHIYDAV